MLRPVAILALALAHTLPAASSDGPVEDVFDAELPARGAGRGVRRGDGR
jgi:hypothetical protein